jgi:hypothetical protein
MCNTIYSDIDILDVPPPAQVLAKIWQIIYRGSLHRLVELPLKCTIYSILSLLNTMVFNLFLARFLAS